MAEKRGCIIQGLSPKLTFFSLSAKKYIHEHEATIEIQDSDMGLTFFSGSSPPRIQKIDIFSYFFGWLFVGDWIVQIDKRVSFCDY
ncbi:unnamed protein product [Meloidogyne enterolobii]|uniref:Uncharacterized protein n=1 Tax=Meloidogyne enterolobii TaxID=390850 RepID=A0ACB0YPK6_MELEN